PTTRGEITQLVVVVMEGQTNLLQVVLATEAVGRFAYFLDSRQKQSDENADNGDHHQKFDKREANMPYAPFAITGHGTPPKINSRPIYPTPPDGVCSQMANFD